MTKRKKINTLMENFKVQPVGNGYIDCIIKENVSLFIEELKKNNITIKGINWWCHYTEQNKSKYGCPHGYGGPKSIYYDGWFSEMCHIPFIETNDDNDYAVSYIDILVKKENFYSPCLVPGLWLSVSED